MVVHLPDSAVRYLSKYLDDAWMQANGFATDAATPAATGD